MRGSTMSSYLYDGETTKIEGDSAAKHDVAIFAVENRSHGDTRYPTETWYKLIRTGNRYLIYTYVVDRNRDLWSQREDSIPKRYSEEQVMQLWEDFKNHATKGAEIGSSNLGGPMFWEVTLKRDGSLNTNPDEDWKASIQSSFAV